MITYGLDEDEAFALLRWHSQHTNIKLRDIAAGITDHTNDPGIAGLTADREDHRNPRRPHPPGQPGTTHRHRDRRDLSSPVPGESGERRSA